MKNLEKQLKYYLKRKCKINLSLLVMFLITGQIGYSLDISGDWVNNDIIQETVNITSPGVTITNNGSIIVNSYSYSSGNGISCEAYGENSSSSIDNIHNLGVISGSSSYYSYSSGNGILSNGYNSSIDNIHNLGVISGSSSYSSYSGNGIFNFARSDSSSSIDNIHNLGVISGNSVDSSSSGNGISCEAYGENSSSSIDNIHNLGVISGSSSYSSYSGNGISSFAQNGSSIENIHNLGVISGSSSYSYSSYYYSGNGISCEDYGENSSSSIDNIHNLGVISGSSSSSSSSYSGNGIFSFAQSGSSSSIDNIHNLGVISGSSSSSSSGNGIFSFAQNGSSIDNIHNLGVISGSNFAIASVQSEGEGDITKVTNNGVLAGKEIIYGKKSEYTNNGVEIILNDSREIKEIVNGNNNIFDDGKNIINAQKYDKNGNKTEESDKAIDSYILSSELKEYDNLIINGAGVETGALVIDKDINIEDSIINGYETAVYLKGENNLKATNITFNGGGLKNDMAVIVGDNGNNKISILGDSIINGDVSLGDGDDNLSIATSTQINGDLIGGIGKDTLSLTNSNTTLNIYSNISQFENININGNTTLFETSKVTGAENINLASGILNLRIDPTKKDSNGKVIGHSLYENSGIINSSGGTLAFRLNGLAENTIISMGETSINPSLDTNYDNTDNLVVTDSIVLDATLVDGSY